MFYQFRFILQLSLMKFSGSFEQGILKLRVPWAYIRGLEL